MTSAHDAIKVMTEAAPIFPPSFDNDPWLFGWALFARMLVFMLSAATIVRLISRNRTEGITASNPVFYHRMVVLCFCAATLLGSLSDVLTFLLWNELETPEMGAVLIVCKILDGLTIIPFLGAMFVPFWMTWARWAGIVPVQKGISLSGTITDLRVTWVTGAIPFQLVILCALASVGVTLGKYAAWAANVAH